MDLDYIDYYYLENGKIIGDFLYHHKGTYLEIDIRSDKYKLRVRNGWFPDISDVHNQYYYAILSQIDLLDLLNENMGLSQKSKQMIISAYENMGQEITEKDNFVIMRLRKKL